MARVDWWYDDTGTNLLKGVEDDTDNPIMMEGDMIIDFLSTIPAALESFNRLVPTMLVAEQNRLNILAIGIPKYTYRNEKIFHDNLQRIWNRAGVRLEKPKGRG